MKIAGAVILLAVLFYFRSGIFTGLSYGVRELFRPILIFKNGAGGKMSGLGAYFASKNSLSSENENLKRQLALQEARMLNYGILLAENESLKKILLRVPPNKTLALAAILSRPVQSPYDTITLDLGEENGVNPGDIVFAEGNIPIGRVNSATRNIAVAVLFSSPREKTQVIIPASLSQYAKGDASFELIGRGGGNFEMILPRDFILEIGAQAVLPGMMPQAIAVTKAILSDPRDPFKKALFASPVNIQELKFVQVEL